MLNQLLIFVNFIKISTIFLFFISCNRIKNKGIEIAENTKNNIHEKSNNFRDKFLPKFDAYQADTKFNKRRFKDFIQIELTPDIRNIYCFDDATGIDSDYQFAFNCSKETADKLIKKHQMKSNDQSLDYAFSFQNDFKWWDKKKIKKLKLYYFNSDNNYYQYFWYDELEHQAYYFDFDM
ncbi:MAG: hypothetical protein HYR91_03555 [Flavobacteriia bacterium]|nr:hypothetical protein [Flavobacteriia bacterium]